MNILNLTQHAATQEQIAAGVVDLKKEDRAILQSWLTFDKIPSPEEIKQVAVKVAEIAAAYSDTIDVEKHDFAMIGGAPFLMGALEQALIERCVTPLYAFSQRVSVEKMVDGKVIKVNEFQHLGWVKI